MFFKEKYNDSAKLLAPPIQQYPVQHFNFRPPDKLEAPPSWWTGERCGECGGGGGFNGVNTIREFWRNYHYDDDAFIVRLVAEDVIVGSQIRRHERLEAKTKREILGPWQAERMEGALRRARTDLVASRPEMAAK